MYDLDDLDKAWNEYFELDHITPPEYDDEEETDFDNTIEDNYI